MAPALRAAGDPLLVGEFREIDGPAPVPAGQRVGGREQAHQRIVEQRADHQV